MTIASSLLCVHAHPDDEALFTGGILARSHDEGARTNVVCCTYQYVHERVNELRTSLEILGAGEPRLLGYDDSGRDKPNKFCDAPFAEAVGKLVAHIREFRPEVVVTYDAFGVSGHPDHQHAHRVTLAAVEAAAYPQLYPEAGPAWQAEELWLVTYPRSVVERIFRAMFNTSAPAAGPGIPGVADERVDVRVDVSDYVDRKWAAFRAHESEIARGAGAARFMSVPEATRAELMGTEWFIRRALVTPTASREALA